MRLNIEATEGRDKDKRVLAEALAAYYMSGSSAEPDERLMLCYRQLAYCDQLDVDMQARKICAAHTFLVKRHSQNSIIALVKAVVLLLVPLSLLVLLVMCSGSMPGDAPLASLDERVARVLSYEVTHDITGDGIISCVDYTARFKRLWDYYYPKNKQDCEPVWNYNKPVLNHLFVRVRASPQDKWVYIEPSCPVLTPMEDVWGSMYDSSYNIYGVQAMRWITDGRQQ